MRSYCERPCVIGMHLPMEIFSTDGRKVKIRYFCGKNQMRIVDDEWLTEIENDLKQSFEQTIEILQKLSPKPEG